MGKIREFETGANRNAVAEKRDIEGFISPAVLKVYSDYMHKHRHLADGTLRASDNWQKGISKEIYMQCLQRHNLDLWLLHRGQNSRHDFIESACGILFNTMGLIHEYIKEHPELMEFEDEEL